MAKVKVSKTEKAVAATTKRGRTKKGGTKSPGKITLSALLSTSTVYLERLRQSLRPKVKTARGYRPSKKIFLVAALCGLALIFVYNRGWFIAATVNSSPITNVELQNRLNEQYREQTLTQMINEKIILDEARKKGILVASTDVNDKIAQLEKNVGGASALDGLLAQQGQTRQQLKEQLSVQLTIEKLYDKDATVSAEEVQQYIDLNKDVLQATTAAEQRQEAEDTLKQQKLSEVFREKFQQLKQQSRVTVY